MQYTKALGALISVDLENAGEHTLEMRYMPKAFVLGASCSAVCILLFIFLCVLEFVKKKDSENEMLTEADFEDTELIPLDTSDDVSENTSQNETESNEET